MKNPHGVEPTRYMKREESKFAICNDHGFGPAFGDGKAVDIAILLKDGTCFGLIVNDGTHGYKCHPEYKSSLYVGNLDGLKDNIFFLLECEVYCIDNYKDYVYNTCKYPDIIWNCIETNEIDDQPLNQIVDDVELLKDINTIDYKVSTTRLKISQYYLKNPSKVLPNTQLVDQQYDSYLRKWLGSYYNWKLIYRASEHGYTAESFHECCNDKGPTFVIIRSTEGWLFGGYTTKSWSGDCIYEMIYLLHNIGETKNDSSAFIFTLKNPYGVEPTQYMKRRESKWVILCQSDKGPQFCNERGPDIVYVFQNGVCHGFIGSDGTHGYECHPEYKSSLYVGNTDGPDGMHSFSVLECEVFAHM